MGNSVRARRPSVPGRELVPHIGPPDPASLIPTQRRRRERIVQQAMRLLGQREYDAIQMRDVADAADVALGTVYRYFVSKEHLFAAVLVEWSDSLRGRVQREPLQGESIPDQLEDLLLRVAHAFERFPQFFRLITTIENTADPYARTCYEEFTGRTNATFAEPLSSLDPAEADAVLTVLMAVLGAVLRGWSHGTRSMEHVRSALRSAVRLIFSAPPAPNR